MSLTPEQIALRRNTLGASEIAAVCGMDPFAGPWDVWADKLGLDIREEFAESDMGHLFERPLLEHYSQEVREFFEIPETEAEPKYEDTAERDYIAYCDGLSGGSEKYTTVRQCAARMLGGKTSESILTIDDLADRLDSLLTRKDKQPK